MKGLQTTGPSPEAEHTSDGGQRPQTLLHTWIIWKLLELAGHGQVSHDPEGSDF